MSGVHHGIHAALEAAANEIIFGSLKGVTSQAAKSDILTPWKEHDRRSREVFSSTGSVDPQLRRGMYHRAANPSAPHLNSRDGRSRAVRIPRVSEFKTRAHAVEADED